MTAVQMSEIFTRLAIREMIVGYHSQLEEIAGLDRLFGVDGRQSRDVARTRVQLQLEIAEHALELRKQTGKR